MKDIIFILCEIALMLLWVLLNEIFGSGVIGVRFGDFVFALIGLATVSKVIFDSVYKE